MYQFVTGFYKALNNRVDWVEDPIELGRESLALLFSKYYQVRIVLSAPSLSKLQFITIDGLPTNARIYQKNIIEYLKENGDRRLPTLNYVEEKKPGHVKYLNYMTQGYKALSVNINKHHDANINRDEKIDVLLFRDDLYRSDYDDIVSKSVAICNGLLHQCVAGDKGVYLLNAGTTTRLSNVNSFGILDFSEIGEIKTIQIKEEHIIKYMPGEDLEDAIYLMVPEEYAGKAVMISIGGYLYYLGNIMTRINERLFKIETDKAIFIKRIYESKRYGFDVSSLGVMQFENSNDILLGDFTSDDFYKRLLTHPLSFFIIANVNDYVVEKIIHENPRYPGKYLTHQLPEYPVISELGLIPNFHYRYIDGVYVLHTDLLTRYNTIYTTTQWKIQKRLSFTVDTYNPRYYQNASKLIIRYSTE